MQKAKKSIDLIVFDKVSSKCYNGALFDRTYQPVGTV